MPKTETLVQPVDLSSSPTSNCSELSNQCDECKVFAPSLLCRVVSPTSGYPWNKHLCNTCRLLLEANIEQRTRSAAAVNQYVAAIAADAVKTCVTEDHDKCWISRPNAERRVEYINKLLRRVTADIAALEQFRC